MDELTKAVLFKFSERIDLIQSQIDIVGAVLHEITTDIGKSAVARFIDRDKYTQLIDAFRSARNASIRAATGDNQTDDRNTESDRSATQDGTSVDAAKESNHDGNGRSIKPVGRGPKK